MLLQLLVNQSDQRNTEPTSVCEQLDTLSFSHFDLLSKPTVTRILIHKKQVRIQDFGD